MPTTRRLVLAILPLVLSTTCQHPTSPRQREGSRPTSRLNEADRRHVATRFRTAIEQAGGLGVWVKPSARASFTEVLAVPPAFESLWPAIERESERAGLKAVKHGLPLRGPDRALEVEILQGQEPVCAWRIHEVPRIQRAAIIIDDLGQDLHAARRLLELPYPLTFSVLPRLEYSRTTADEAHGAHREVMLHLPMQPRPGAPVQPGADPVEVGMTQAEVARVIQASLASVPFAAGVNNHMGSRATADPRLMAGVMSVLAERRLYFIDSRTTPDSVALDEARRAGLPAFYRSVFLDDVQTVPYVLGQLARFRRIVAEQGTAVAIGHPHPATIEALRQFLPQLEQDDIELVPASRVVSLPEIARLSRAHSRR